MKKTIILILALIASLGCIQMAPPEEDLTGFKDCENSKECLLEAVQQGEKAFSTIEQETGDMPFGIRAKVISYGFEGGKSKVKLRIEEILPKEESDGTAQLAAAILQGKEMTCLVTEQQMQDIESLDQQTMQENCTGSLVDIMQQFQGMQ